MERHAVTTTLDGYDRDGCEHLMMNGLPVFRLLFLFVSGCFLLSIADAAEKSPNALNVLFIAVDDLNDWTACMGARRGVHCQQACILKSYFMNGGLL